MSDNFAPQPKTGFKLSASTDGTNRGKLREAGGSIDVVVTNLGSAPIWLCFGEANVTASMTSPTADQCVAAGTTQTFKARGSNAIWVAIIAAGATGDVWFNQGFGQ